MNVVCLDRQGVPGGAERHVQTPIRHGGPGDRVSDAVDSDRVHLDRRISCERDEVVRRRVRPAGGEVRRVCGGQPGQNAGARAGEIALQGAGRGDVDAAGLERGESGVHHGIDVGGEHRSLAQFLERAPVRATEGRRLVNLLHRAVGEVGGKQLLSRPPGAAVAEDNIVVPDEQGPLAVHRLVAIHVLFVLAAKSIPITDGMFDRKRPHPLLHVRDGLQARRIGRVRRIDQREDIGVVVGGAVDGARQVIPAVTGQLFVAVRARVIVERAPGIIVEAHLLGIGRVEFEPRLKFVEKAVRVVREIFIDHFVARHLGVLHQRAAPAAVDEHGDVAAVKPRQSKLAHQPETGLLALDRVVVKRPVSGRVNLVEVVRAEEQVVERELHRVMATPQRRRKALVIRAAGITRAEVVNHAVIAVNERAVYALVAQHGPVDPGCDGLLREPLPVHPKTHRRRRVIEAHQTFARRRVVRERGDGAATVRGLNIKRDDATRLARNLRGENSVTGDRIAACAVIGHRHR